MSAASKVSNPLSRGHAALKAASWAEARAAFEDALAREESPEAFEGLAWAAWWLDDADASLSARERAFASHRAAGDDRAAARVALFLVEDYLSFRGEPAIANGWHQRARRLLRDLEPGVEHGWLALFEGAWALEHGNDGDAARALAAQAIESSRRFDDFDLGMLGLAVEGLALVTSGQVDEGMRRLDEATAAAVAGEFHEVYAIGWATCYLIYACEQVRDLDRAAQWCDRLAEFAQRLRTRFWMGVCHAHYGAVLTWRGAWAEAEQELVAATERLSASRPPTAGEGIVRLADLRRRQGSIQEAAELFDRAGPHPLALLGRAEMALERGDVGEADGLLEQLRRNIPPSGRTQRAPVLDLMVRSKVALGDLESADACLEEFREIALSIGTGPMRAGLAFAEGVVASAREMHDKARASFEDAAALYAKAGAPFETALAQLELARALSALGRDDAAAREAERARAGFERIGAGTYEERARSAAGRLAGDPGRGGRGPAKARDGRALTPREIEILLLIAQGLSDRQMASKLTLSEHTIHRHVSKILVKLTAPSRAAAVALAAERGLL